MKKIALVFGNGTYENSYFYLNLLKNYHGAFIVAVDGGYDFLEKIHIKPNLLIGDLDSIKSANIDMATLKAPSEKDETDTRLTLDYLYENNFKEVILLGMLSTDRIDHSLVNILLLEKYLKLGLEIKIINPSNEIFCARGPFQTKFINKEGSTLSLIPLSDKIEGISITGVKYPLVNKNLNRELADLTVSNIIKASKASLEFKSGILLIDIIKKED